MYGVGKEGLEIARNTYLYDPDAQKFRSHIGWKQDNIWAACLGMTEEAAQLTLEKMANGPHRFPAFWGPGYDWTPDHNWGRQRHDRYAGNAVAGSRWKDFIVSCLA